MSLPQRYALVWFLLATSLALLLHIGGAPVIEGVVVDEAGPIAGAAVGWQGRCERVTSDTRGRYRLAGSPRPLVASKLGYRIVSGSPGDVLRLVRLPIEDARDYAWIDPHPDPLTPKNCGNCHTEIYREWQRSAHAHSATNPKFLQLFAGTDGKSPPHQTWNVRAEHPLGAGVCAKCHAPTLDSPTLEYDVREARGVDRAGIHCDYCHKIADAPTDKLGTRFGRDGLMLLRPAAGDALTFGPLDDAIRAGETFAALPFYKESRYCASCHEGIVFGVHAYGTYSEWLESPSRAEGKQCQHCHMTPTGRMTNIAPNRGGIERDAATLASHVFPGGERALLGRSVTMTVRTKATDRGRRVEVEITAAKVGHRVPTGFVDRQLVLTIDCDGELIEGGKLPASVGRWAGLPGMLYAKQLIGEAPNTPTPFWLPVVEVNDTRLLPNQPDRRSFLFAANANRLTARLWYRRFWQTVADARGWTDNDVLLSEQTLSLTVENSVP